MSNRELLTLVYWIVCTELRRNSEPSLPAIRRAVWLSAAAPDRRRAGAILERHVRAIASR